MPDLNTSVQYIKGVGEARAKLLAKLGIRTLFDLISYFPRDYEDRTKVLNISSLPVGQPVCFEAVVMTTPRSSRVRANFDLTKCRVADDTAALNLTFFNNRHYAEKLKVGESYIFYGTLTEDERYGHQMTNPLFESAETDGVVTRRIMPIYRLTAGLSNNQLVKAISGGLTACSDILPDCLPSSIRQQYGLCHARYAYENIHNPKDEKALADARKRLIFEEFFVFSAGLTLLRSQRTNDQGRCFENLSLDAFLAALPFVPTGAQRRAMDDAVSDMGSGKIMSRLVQGDVGSGKTVVAAAAAFVAFQNGCQSALMAPTEILAEQHFRTLSELLEPLGVKTVLLTGSMKASAKRNALELIALGMADLVVGTHALISESVLFKDLSLVIADEQHRFGVAQRAALSAKGSQPHVLVMSATPIPRTLALMMYGDLDVSIIDERPPGRQEIDTFLVNESMRQRINAFIRKQIDEGHQVYIVCPMVEEGEDENLKAAQAYAEQLSNGPLNGLQIGLVHGKMKGSDKDKVMRSFSEGSLDVLVSTTVIEVGVDVPNASLIVIENAERFGLSQLHQLRGRVGRGQHKSYCVMFSSAEKIETLARLKVLCSTNDGFKISEEDLKLRGPGDFFGSRQHGLPAFNIADLAEDSHVLYQAREAADRYLKDNPVSPVLMSRIQTLFEENGNIFN